MPTAILIDDMPQAIEGLKNDLKKYCPEVEIIGTAAGVIEGAKLLRKQSPDLLFLDINMPDISGLSFAKAIGKDTKIIFTTAYREYAIDGFDLQAVDYLLKPISLERLIQAVQKFQSEQAPNVTPNFLFVRSDRKMVKVNFDDILYIESLSDYLKIYTNNKQIQYSDHNFQFISLVGIQ